MILVVIALEEELPGPLPSGYKKLITGVGKVNASVALTAELCYNDHYTKIINYGSAGGSSAIKGELVGVSAVIERDMDCTPLGLPLYVSPGDVEQAIVLVCRTLTIRYAKWKHMHLQKLQQSLTFHLIATNIFLTVMQMAMHRAMNGVRMFTRVQNCLEKQY